MEVPQLSCAWCDFPLYLHQRGAVVRLTAKPELKDEAGERKELMYPYPINLELAGKVVNAIVTAKGSLEEQRGADFVLPMCSEACASELKDALQREKDLPFSII